MRFDDDVDMHAIGRAIGERLRAFREEHGLSQRDIAERTGLAREQITKWEGGDVPSLKVVIILARFMDIDVHQLLFGTPSELPVTNKILRKRILRIERMAFDAQRWVIDLLDAFILKAEVDEETDFGATPGDR